MNLPSIRLFPGLPSLILILLALSIPLEAISKSASAYYEEALSHFNKKEYAIATILLKNSLAEDPAHLTSRILLGNSLLHQGQAISAEKEFRKALQLGGDPELILVPMANALFLQNKFQELLREITESGHSVEVKAEILVLRGYAYIKLGRLDQAVLSFEKARRLAPHDALPVLGLATAEIRRGNLQHAGRLVSLAEQYSPEDAGVFYAKGEIQRLQGHPQQAIRYYDAALKKVPEHLQARQSRAGVLINQGEDERARKDVDFIRKRSPNDLYGVYLDAILLARNGKYDEAISEIQTITNALSTLKSDYVNSNGPTLVLMGMLEYFQNHLQRAAYYLQRYLELYPHHLHPRMVLAEIRIKTGDNVGAIILLRPVLREYPENTEALILLGTALLNEKRYSEANQILEKAVSLKPNNAALRTRLALSRLGGGDTTAAMDELETVLQMDAKSPRPGLLLAMMQLRKAKYDQALTTLEKLKQRYPDSPVVWNLFGAAKLGTGDIAAARRAFEAAIRIDEDFALAHLNLANLDIRKQNYSAAREHYEKIMRRDPQNIPALSGMARLAELQKESQQAISWLEKILEIQTQTDISPELLKLARLYLENNQPESALETAERLEKLKPLDPSVLEVKGIALLTLRKTASAAKEFRAIYAMRPTAPAILNRIGVLLLQAQDLETAGKAIRSALKKNPNYLPARKSEVALQALGGHLEKAKKLALQLQKEHPRNALGYKLMGDLLLQSGDPRGAFQAYKAALKRQPSTDLLLDQVRAKQAAGQAKAALALMNDWLKSNPDDYRIRNLVASIEERSGQLDSARRHFEILARQRPKDALILNGLAFVYQAQGDSRALDYARKAYAIEPSDPAINDTLGWIMVENGNAKEGLEYLRQARARAFLRPEIRYHLAVALHQLGRNAEAEQELNEALNSKTPFQERPAAQTLLAELHTKGK